MKLLVLSFVAMFSMNTYALTHEQVKNILTKAISIEEPTSDLKVLKVQSTLNPIIGLGQIVDGVIVTSDDYEHKYVTFEFSSPEYGRTISKCPVMVSVSKNKIAYVTVDECKSSEPVFGRTFPRNIDIDTMDVSDLL